MWRTWIAVLVGTSGCDWVFGLDRSSPVSPDARTAGLVAWYPMDEVPSAQVPDATGNGHHAACKVGCPVQVAGRVGSGLYFDGAGSHLEIASAAELNTMQGFTVAAWFRAESSADRFACLFAKQYGTTTDNSWELCTDNDAPFFGAGGATLVLPPFVGAWHHAAFTWDAATATVIGYVDGVVVTSAPITVLFDDHPVTIGADIDFGIPFAFFKGVLDDLRIYEVALGATEVAALHQAP